MDESSDTTTHTRLDLQRAIDIELTRIAQGPPGEEADRARSELLRRHESIVHDQANLAGDGDEDLAVKAAQRALHQAVRNFDPDRGDDFADYATARVRAAVRDCSGPRRPSVPNRGMRQGRFLQVRIKMSEIAGQRGSSPQLREVADELGYDTSEVLDALAVRSAERVRTAQLAVRLAEDEGQVIDLTGALSELDERTRLVLFRLECDGRSRRAIATELGVSTFDVLDLEQQGRRHVRRVTP